jgi:cytochrome P450
MNKGFSPAAIESLRPQVEKIVDCLVTPFRKNYQVDIIPQFAHPLPAYVIAKLLNVPESLHQQFVQWSNAVATLFGNPYRTVDDLVTAQKAIQGLTSYFREAVAARRNQKGNDLISLLMEIEEDGDVLTEEELYAQCVMLLFGGHETTRNLIGNGLYTLLRHPEQAAELRDNPELIRSAVEELLRYESPVQYTGRMVLEDFEFCGIHHSRSGFPTLVSADLKHFLSKSKALISPRSWVDEARTGRPTYRANCLRRKRFSAARVQRG